MMVTAVKTRMDFDPQLPVEPPKQLTVSAPQPDYVVFDPVPEDAFPSVHTLVDPLKMKQQSKEWILYLFGRKKHKKPAEHKILTGMQSVLNTASKEYR
jgi:hypothetical protein